MTLREERAKQRALKRKKERLVIFFSVFVAIIVIVLAALGIFLKHTTPEKLDINSGTTERKSDDAEDYCNSFLASSAVLWDYVLENSDIESTVKKELGDAFNSNLTVFISVSDSVNRAYVVNASAATLAQAWKNAEEKVCAFIRRKPCDIVYVKADIVNKIEKMNSSSLSSRISAESGIYGEYFRKGIAFDSTFNASLLEAEINSNELIDYDINKNLTFDKVSLYFKDCKNIDIKSMPDTVYLFSCRGYIKDSDGCYTLNYDNNSSYGRRISSAVDYNYISDTVKNVSKYMFDNMTADGKFSYGIYPVVGLPIEQYNISYHSMAVSALCNYSGKFDTAGLYESKLDSAVNYLFSQLVTAPDGCMYASNADSEEITAGGNLQAVSALIDYQNYKGAANYNDTIKKLGDGILNMIDASTGKLNHILYYKSDKGADFAVKTAQSDRAYDTESVYVLSKLYGAVKDEKYLTAAQKLTEVLIRENYTQYGDSRLTIAMYELVKYAKNPEYYNLALKNFNDNIEAIETRIISSAQYTELLIGTYNIYRSMQSEKITTEMFTALDKNRLTTAAVKRAEDLLNSIAYPEIAMYFANPSECIDSFFVRQDGFRIRLDDISAFIRAYLDYAENYTAISADAFNASAAGNNT